MRGAPGATALTVLSRAAPILTSIPRPKGAAMIPATPTSVRRLALGTAGAALAGGLAMRAAVRPLAVGRLPM